MPDRLIGRAAAVTVVLLAAAACGSKQHGGTAASSGPGARPSTSGTVASSGATASDYGVPVQQLARRVPDCAPHRVDAATVTRLGFPRAGRLLDPAMSAAACTLKGRTAVLVSYPTRRAESAAASAAYATTACFASGPGWLAVPVDLRDPVGQLSVIQGLALDLGGRIVFGAKEPRASASGG